MALDKIQSEFNQIQLAKNIFAGAVRDKLVSLDLTLMKCFLDGIPSMGSPFS